MAIGNGLAAVANWARSRRGSSNARNFILSLLSGAAPERSSSRDGVGEAADFCVGCQMHAEPFKLKLVLHRPSKKRLSCQQSCFVSVVSREWESLLHRQSYKCLVHGARELSVRSKRCSQQPVYLRWRMGAD